jgi:predicted dehydrogenase
MTILRVGLIGAGGNTRLRHIPGLRVIPNVEIVAVCNRRPESTAEIAREFAIPRTFQRWEDLAADPGLDAIVIGAWPNLHCPATLAALAAGKHVLTEARMALNAAEAYRMLGAARSHPNLVAQVVPSPFGLKGNRVMRRLIGEGFLGELREIAVTNRNAALADPDAPLSWRQDASLSGVNLLTLGIHHETLLRWVPGPVRVLAQTHAFIPKRLDAAGALTPVGTPDSAQVLTQLANGTRAVYQFSGVTPFGQESFIRLCGTDGTLHYNLLTDQILGASRRSASAPGPALEEIPIPAEEQSGWNVEADWVDSIRHGEPVKLTDFATGAAYMEFTEAVVQSAASKKAVELPVTPL